MSSSENGYYDDVESVWYGPTMKTCIPENGSLGDLIMQNLKIESSSIFQVCDDSGVEYSGNDLRFLASCVAQNLLEKGLKQNDIIGFIAPNTYDLSVYLLGSIFSGAIINPMDLNCSEEELKHTLAITRPKFIFCDSTIINKLQKTLKQISLNTSVFVVCGEAEEELKSAKELLHSDKNKGEFIIPKLELGDDQVVVIMCSSGSTGLPKCICISHKLIIKGLLLFGDFQDIVRDQVIFTFAPLCWYLGIFCLLFGFVHGYKRIVTRAAFKPKLFLDLVQKYKVSLVFCSSIEMAMITQDSNYELSDMSSIMRFYYGGMSTASNAPDKIKPKISGKIIASYGLSEVGFVTLGALTSLQANNATGKVFPKYKIKITNESNVNLGPKLIGEICVNTECTWKGYYGNVAATKEAYDANNGWIRTGDLGYFDEQQYLIVVGRKKEMIKCNNHYVAPVDIERKLLELENDISEVSVCGIEVDNEELPAAAVLRKVKSNITEKEISKYIASQLDDSKHLRGGVYFIDEFPRTVSGKIQKSKVKNILQKLYVIKN